MGGYFFLCCVHRFSVEVVTDRASSIQFNEERFKRLTFEDSLTNEHEPVPVS